MDEKFAISEIYKNFDTKSVWYTFKALGTYIFIQIVVDDVSYFDRAENDIKLVEQLFLEKQNLLSRFDHNSELCKLNNNLGTFFEVSEDLYNISVHSLNYNKESTGIFDPRILNILESIGYKKNFLDGIEEFSDDIAKIKPFGYLENDILFEDKKICFNNKIDFSGIAKGYINDLAVNFLHKNGWENFVVDSGGDLYASGLNDHNEKWSISIEGGNNLFVSLSNQSIATSGTTYRKWTNNGKKYYHLINPKKTDEFSTNFLSVSVIKDTTEEADVWAKVLFLMGEEAKQYAISQNIKVIFLYLDGCIWKNF